MARKLRVRREILERAARPLLARFLAPFAPFFGAQGVDLAALGASDLDDAAPARALYGVLVGSRARAVPDALAERLVALDALATPDGAAELVRLDVERRLPRGTHGDEDLALHALVEHPALADQARVAAAREPGHKFAEYAPARAPARPLVLDDGAVERLRADLALRFERLDHTAYCEVVVVEDGPSALLEIDHGSRPRTRARVDPASLRVDPASLRVGKVTDVTARRSYARLERASGRLAVRALPAVREHLRRALGVALAGDDALFRAQGLYDLSPLRDPAAMLSTEGVDRLVRVTLQVLSLATPDGVSIEVSRGRLDLLASSAAAALAPLLAVAEPVGVRLYLYVLGRARGVRLELHAEERQNAVEFDRDDPEVALVVTQYLRARGVLRALDGRQSLAAGGL